MIVLDTHIWYWWINADHGRLSLALSDAVRASGRAVELTDRHRDPFDRIIIATALEFDARLASVDGQFRPYPELADRLLA